MTDDPAEPPEAVPLVPDFTPDGDDEAIEEDDGPELPPAVRERRLRETVDDESEQRHREARESADPDDHRDEAPNDA